METSHLATFAFITTTTLLPADELLIGPGLRNGGFESEQTKQTSWDTVTSWTNWDASVGGPSTANNDSGCEPVGGNNVLGFMQPGNAVYNLTDYLAQPNDEFDIVFEKQDTDSMQVTLVYENNEGDIVALPFNSSNPTRLTTGTQSGTLRLARVKLPSDNSLVGRRIGIGLINKSDAFPNFDNFQLIRRSAGDRFYVDASRSGQSGQNGSSWEQAFASLQDALLLASADDEVWVRQGVYHPDEADAGIVTVTADDPFAYFEVVSGVKLYGGFAGTETELTQRDTSKRSILSGDITQDDSSVDDVIQDNPETNIVGNNSRVIINSEDSLLDGFTVTASQNGAAYQGSGTLRRVDFQGNLGGESGALYGGGTLQLTECAFYNNQGYGAGAVYIGNDSNTVIDRCHFKGNRTTSITPYSTGAIRLDRAVAEIRNSGFSGNTGGGKGAILATGFAFGSPAPPLTLINCTIAGNSATWTDSSGVTAGGVGVFEGATIAIYNSVIWGNASTDSISADGVTTLESSLIEGLNPGGSNLNGIDSNNDPKFLTPVAGSSAPNTSGDYRLGPNSPLTSAADPSFLPADSNDSDEDGDFSETSPLDLNAAPRIQGGLEMGAYELESGSSLALFRSQYGLNSDGSDDFLDWSNNGISNILYLAFGLGDPNEANIDRSRLPAVSGISDHGDYAVSFVEPNADAGLILTMATSDDLSTWPDLDDMETAYQPVHAETESLDANYDRQTLHFDTVPGEGRRFYRMDVEVSDEEAAAP